MDFRLFEHLMQEIRGPALPAVLKRLFVYLAVIANGLTPSLGTAATGCNSVVTFADGLVPAREIHVATDGSDTNGDGSSQAPYATIDYALSQATAGAAVRIHPGIYAGGIYHNNLSGSLTAPIWIGGLPGAARPVIDGGATGIQLSRAKYVVLHDLVLRNASQNGINCDDGGDTWDPLAAHHIVFDNLSVHDIGGSGNQDGLKLSGIRDYHVLDSEFRRCGGGNSGSGIDHVGCHRGLIARCTFEDISGNAIQCKGGSADIEIRWCRITNAGQRGINIGGSTGFAYFRPPLTTSAPNFEARNIRVLANIFEGTITPLAFVGSVDSLAAHNSIINPTNWLMRILQETTSSGAYTFLACADNAVVNNIFYFDRSDLSAYVNIGSNTDAASFTFANNLWYAHDDPSASTPTLPASETDGLYAQDPNLDDVPGGNYAIDGNSPAFRNGWAPALIGGDYSGACYWARPSIGAYEHVPVGYVDHDPAGMCSGLTPCYDTLEDAAGAAGDAPLLLYVEAGAYSEANLSNCEELLLSGGWSDDYTSQADRSHYPSITVQTCLLALQKVTLE
jgi:hypothetical protein